ncbi:glucoamylase [Mycolicibacterium novocastrense]|uniref:Trehalase n=1 Tax=Mycolicibacterium novocastrense TaxID=59813 RepID=A0AAW5SJM9_MYCNV|nr:glycoside hydrolase family 15 protein [Mycolicibacterium novocastrense]KUH65497.1 glucoamylase [Mycolicibacterium novocastrense]KUH77322.1 glucoamylase [Mycolicibacterium novocastrense]KUH77653.1 glucoamylase [Mycolicibacterium novocastrense]MCV7023454.1 glycoside hydrolase family 15 protein [Mycolicibacterium novocastrense]GAT12329.1 glucoamylase-like glycosyl hydrolase [Mycolicibacterium novocastrense]
MALIEDYALLGDLQTAALVGRDGAIDWLCLPRFDSPACFAALLGGEEAGLWRLGPAAGGPATRRRYRGDSLVLESEWDTPDGTVRVLDCMPPRGGAADVVRVVEGVSGRVPMRMTLRLRFDYGHIVPWVRREDGVLAAVAGPDAVWLHTPVAYRGEDLTTVAEFEVAAGQRLPFVLVYTESHLPRPEPVDPERALVDTERFWSDWISRCRYRGRWEEEVRRSLVLLKALTYAPTGGIAAAATTSLPEQLGGERNWDYRYCWLRDATFTLQALLGTGFVAEARAWREWLIRAVAGDPAELRIMYGLDGSRRLPEYELPWLPGYEGSAPVRIGNDAAGQFQLDVWGEVLDSMHLARVAGLERTDTTWGVQRALLDYLEGNWDEPDNSLWEMRGPRRHFVHSKVMAWAGVDRAVHSIEKQNLEGPVDKWRELRERIHSDVCTNGYDAQRNTFTQYYGSKGLDAALLLIPRVGFLPWSDPRVRGTVDAVREELSVDGFLLRYNTEMGVDGLPGEEGAFLMCSFWLVDALHGTGRSEEATSLFTRLLGLRNDVGMLSEEYDPYAGRHLGNTPQAFSLVGLINSARDLSGIRTETDALRSEQDLR